MLRTARGDVAQATRQLIERAAPPGVYQRVSSGATTWFDLGQEIVRDFRQ